MGFNVNIRQILTALPHSSPILLFAGYDNYIKSENVLYYLADNTGPQKKTVGSGMETILFFCIFSR